MQFILPVLLLFPFIVYRLTASPTIGWVDSGVIAAPSAPEIVLRGRLS